jgi:glucokinase
MNDFVANAYGVAALQDEKDLISIYEPPESERTADKMRLVFGVGTGLGVSILARPNETVPFQAYPSEGGVICMPYYNKSDREYLKFLKDKKYNETPLDGSRDDVSMVLAGQAISWVTEFLAT